MTPVYFETVSRESCLIWAEGKYTRYWASGSVETGDDPRRLVAVAGGVRDHLPAGWEFAAFVTAWQTGAVMYRRGCQELAEEGGAVTLPDTYPWQLYQSPQPVALWAGPPLTD